MRWRRMVERMARSRSGMIVLSGLAAVLGGVEKVLSGRPQTRVESATRLGARATAPSPAAARLHYFTIRQTRSELGYVYWVLQGFGYFQSFALFDTWAEAMQSADERIVVARNTLRAESESVARECDTALLMRGE